MFKTMFVSAVNRKRFLSVVASLFALVLIGVNIHSIYAAQVQLTSRSATINKSIVSSTNVQFVFGYTLATSQAYQSLTYRFCTTPNGTCTTPTGLVANTGVSHSAQTGFPTNGTAFAVRGTATDLNNCLMSSAQFSCYTRTAATAGNGAVTHTINGVTGPTVVGTVYIRITAYPTTDYSGANFDFGTVSVSFNSSATSLTAKVQEALTICIGSGKTNAVGANQVAGGANVNVLRNTNDTADVTSCTNLDGTSVNLGTINSTPVVSPVSSATGGDGRNGYVFVSTNALNGALVSYRAVQDTPNGGRLKVPGQACSGSTALDSGSSNTDQCINSTATQTILANDVEQFGMTIGGVSCYLVPPSGSGGYTCDYTTGATNLRPVAGYIGAAANAYGTTNGFAWDQSGTAVLIARSDLSSNKKIYNEVMLMRFGATATSSTPTGSYETQVDFIVTPTF